MSTIPEPPDLTFPTSARGALRCSEIRDCVPLPLHYARLKFRAEETFESFSTMSDTWPSAVPNKLGREWTREDGSVVSIAVSRAA